MPAKRNARIDPSARLHVNVVNQSPHVVAYKIWIKRPGQDWTAVGQGHTADQVADFLDLDPLAKGAMLDYWFGIGGNAQTNWRALLTLSQNGRIVDGGLCDEHGT